MARTKTTPQVPAIAITRNLNRFLSYDIIECDYDKSLEVLAALDSLIVKFEGIRDSAKQKKIDALKAILADLEK